MRTNQGWIAALALAGAATFIAADVEAAKIVIASGDANINSVNNAGTSGGGNAAPSSTTRDEDFLILDTDLTATGPGGDLEQPQASANNHYWDNGGAGDVGLLIDLGATYELDAIQLYGYNITDGGSSFHNRSLASFTVWTATDADAASATSGQLLVSDINDFTQQGGAQPMAGVLSSATPGETYLFGGASQPAELGGTTHTVTAAETEARYLFLRNLTAQEASNVVGLGQVVVYGTVVPEPATLGVLGLGAIGLLRRRRRA